MEFRWKIVPAIVGILLTLQFALPAGAVTKEEMEHARAITALWYLRWANNGSDYLESLNPTTLSELEGKLKEKEKQNIKAFKSVAVPTNYASWDKEKAVAYWSVTFFQSPGLDEKGKGARARVSTKLKAMKFSDPAPAQAAEPEKKERATAKEDTVKTPVAPVVEEIPSADQIIEQTNAEESAVIEDSPADFEENRKKSGNSDTWMYIVALVVLVGVVIWLVIFASRTMQNSAKASADLENELAEEEEKTRRRRVRQEDSDGREPEGRREFIEEDTRSESAASESLLRERYAQKLALKEEEIMTLKTELKGLREECLRLSDDNTRLISELSRAQRAASAANVTRKDDTQASVSSVSYAEEERRMRPRPTENVREIYLGRVNSKGVFVRADRKPVDGKSIYVLTTSDAYTGTYRVLQSASTIEMALENPEHYLAGGCVAPDITYTAEADGIRTVSSGTAIFEDGCWKVLRKAKISYE